MRRHLVPVLALAIGLAACGGGTAGGGEAESERDDAPDESSAAESVPAATDAHPGTAPTAAAPSPWKDAVPLDGAEGRFDHLALDRVRGLVYVAAIGNDSVEVADLAAGTARRFERRLRGAAAVVLLPEDLGGAARIAVTSSGEGVLALFDAEGRPVADVGGLDDADNLRWAASAKRLWVGWGDGGLACVDPVTRATTVNVDLPGHPESFQLEERGTRIFVNVPSESAVLVVDRREAKVVAAWDLGAARGNYPMALDEARGRLYVACRTPPLLLAFDTGTGEVVGRHPCCGDADDVWVDAARARVLVSGGDGTVRTWRRDAAGGLAEEATIATAAGARTSLLDPESGRLLVAVPRRDGQRAEVRVVDPARR